MTDNETARDHHGHHRRRRGGPRSAGGAGREDQARPRRTVRAGGAGALAALKKDDRAAFEKLRAQLKKAGCRVTALDKALAEASGETGGRGPTTGGYSTRPRASCRTVSHPRRHRFCRPQRRRSSRNLADPLQGLPPLARLPVISSRPAGRRIPRLCSRHSTSSRQRRRFDAPERIVHVRVGGLDDKIYLDLCDKTWQAVEIEATAGG